MNITIVGGGNIGTQFAVHCAEKGHDVIIATSNPGRFSKHLYIVDRDDKVLHEGDIRMATNDPAEAFGNADVIIITMPPTMMIPLAETVYDNTGADTMIGFVPGNGGFEFAFSKCIERGNIFFGIDRVPAIARLTERGRKVCCSGYKDELYVAAIPGAATDRCAAMIESIYDIPCVRLPGFMALTLTPSNPILHTARLRTIFKDYELGVTYESLPLFYEDWDDESSELLIACDDEIRSICKALPEFGLEYVVSEKEFYNAYTVQDMTNAIRTEESLLGLTTPSVTADSYIVSSRGWEGMASKRQQINKAIREHAERRAAWREQVQKRHANYLEKTEGMSIKERREYVSDRIREIRNEKAEQKRTEAQKIQASFIPDLHSRYFTADFPYGLTVIEQIGKIAGVDMPNIESLLSWYDEIAIVNDKLILSDYGVTDLDSLREFYLR